MTYRKQYMLAAVSLLALLVLVGCGDDLYAGLDPGPTPPAQAGAYVWVVGAPDVILGSADGGASWTQRHRTDTDPFTGDLWAVAFGDVDHGWAVRRGVGSPRTTILTTADAGASWSWQYPKPQGRLIAVAAVGATHAWAVGCREDPDDDLPHDFVIATTDGGSTWARQRIGGDIMTVDVAFADVRHGWIFGRYRSRQGSVILSTSDGGAHWRTSFTTASDLRDVAAAGPERCWAVGATEPPQTGFVAMTTDGGETWTTSSSVAPGPLAAVAFPDALHGWAVGPNGTIVATSDGGATWTEQRTAQRFDLRQVVFIDALRGWALIDHLALLATVDGGETWSVVQPANTRDLLLGLACVQSETTVQP